ncbi:MAG TPA: hypothetical protein PLH49_11510, partial [Chitinophagaceae bacterium]|nr:hypothetical protein [Chitinophagaceae bacterium]
DWRQSACRPDGALATVILFFYRIRPYFMNKKQLSRLIYFEENDGPEINVIQHVDSIVVWFQHEII